MDDDWVWISSHLGRVRCQVKLMDGVNRDTVWTWNAIGKRAGAWNLDPDAPEAKRGFLLNHLICELLPERNGGYRYSNSDPITGQAAWYDLRVNIEKAEVSVGDNVTLPHFEPIGRPEGLGKSPDELRFGCAIPGEAPMTSLPAPSDKKLGLVIDLDTCVGCQACATACKEWNTGGYSAPLSDQDPYGADPHGAWLNRVHGFEAGEGEKSQTVNFPRSCLHCETPDCVTVCPTGASYKREEDGIVLVNPDTCIGCKLCSWACPYGAREYDYAHGVMKKCTLCVDRIYNETLDEIDRIPACVRACPTGARHFGDLGDPQSDVSKLVAERGGYDLLPAMGYKPVNKYLPPRPRRGANEAPRAEAAPPKGKKGSKADKFFAWADQMLSR